MPSGVGMAVYQSCQSSPSRTASHKASWWAMDKGTKLVCVPLSVSGAEKGDVIGCVGS
jgi:hypothetical protein